MSQPESRPTILARCLSFVFALCIMLLTACSDGSDGPSGPRVEGIVAVVGATAVAVYSEDDVTAPPVDLGDFTELRFKFSGPVSPASLPPNGPSQSGAIRIGGSVGGPVPAYGTWTIDSNDPTTVIFAASIATGGASMLGGVPTPCGPRLIPGVDYTIEVVGADSDPASAVDLSGVKVARSLTRTFHFSGSAAPAIVSDPCPGAPLVVVATWPSMGPNAPVVASAAIAAGTGSRIAVDASEPLQPNTILSTSVQIVDVTTPSVSFPLAAQVTLQQSGFFGHPNPTVSRIILETSLPLPSGRTYELRISTTNPPRDLGNNPLSIPAGRFRFSTSSGAATSDFLITDDFATTANLGTISGFVAWSGNGAVAAQTDGKLLSNGSAGTVAFTTNANINTNANQGAFHATSLSIAGNVTLTLTSATNDPATATSNFAARFLAQSTISIGMNAIIDASGRVGLGGVANSQSPGFGGWGGPGGGAGGTASPNPSPTVADPMGGSGEGGKLDGVVNAGQFVDRFGGGGGGSAAPLSNIGPSGGGGGSASNMSMFAATAGESQPGVGAPSGGAAGPLPTAFVPPLFDAIGGSGGGAGGDRQDNPSDPTTYDRGGAGGGGGGAIVISAVSSVTIDIFAQIRVRGGSGGIGAGGVFRANGGGGSGGSMIVRSFAGVSMASGVTFTAENGTGGGATSPLDGDGGIGGDGLSQFEDSDGVIPGLAQGLVIGETSLGVIPFLQGLTGTARSIVFDTGSLAPEYLATNSLGTTGFAANGFNVGSLAVSAVGIREDPNAPGQPAIADPSLISMPVALADIAQLNGYRFIRFEITTMFSIGDLANSSAILPACDSIAIAYRR